MGASAGFSNGTPSHVYSYGSSDWRDLLTAVDGQSISYDNIGNPTSYYNGTRYSMSWSEGRRLSSLTTGGNTTTYTYDLNGLRNKKVNSDGTWVKYFIADGKIIGETRYPASGGYLYDMRYTFDENGDVCGISIWNNGDNHWTRYYFLKSLQGDVLAVYQYGDTFTKVAEYTYDSWGNVLTKSGALADINPFRYRSYYQDTETGFYYLKARYYDPAIGRFINADEFASTGQDFVGYNMFAYCHNSPADWKDDEGKLGVFALCAISGIVSGVFAYAESVAENYINGDSGADAWVRNVNWGSVASSTFSGAISALPSGGLLR